MSLFRSSFLFHITQHLIFNMSTGTDATNGAKLLHAAQSYVFCIVFCRPLFLLFFPFPLVIVLAVLWFTADSINAIRIFIFLLKDTVERIMEKDYMNNNTANRDRERETKYPDERERDKVHRRPRICIQILLHVP